MAMRADEEACILLDFGVGEIVDDHQSSSLTSFLQSYDTVAPVRNSRVKKLCAIAVAIAAAAALILAAAGVMNGRGQVLFSKHNLEELYTLKIGEQNYSLAAATVAVVQTEAGGVRDISPRSWAGCAMNANLVLLQMTRVGVRTGQALYNCKPEALGTYVANVTCMNNLAGIFSAVANIASELDSVVAGCDQFHTNLGQSCASSITKMVAETGTMMGMAAAFDLQCHPFPSPPGPEKREFPDFSKFTQRQLDFYRLNKVNCVVDSWEAALKVGQTTVAALGFDEQCTEEGFSGCDWRDNRSTCVAKIKDFMHEKRRPCARDVVCDDSDGQWFCKQKLKVCRLEQARLPIRCAGLMGAAVYGSFSIPAFIASDTGTCAPQTNALPGCVRALFRLPALLANFVQTTTNAHLTCGQGGEDAEFIDYVEHLQLLKDNADAAELNLEKVKELRDKIKSLHIVDPYPEDDALVQG
mmetsp:Transcript_79399/g.174138  ORF Transcript_79399/g.174138 Transcript_79399/m.174138 type:complete len:469 (+) Transcript_79399:311-1717(+)